MIDEKKILSETIRELKQEKEKETNVQRLLDQTFEMFQHDTKSRFFFINALQQWIKTENQFGD